MPQVAMQAYRSGLVIELINNYIYMYVFLFYNQCHLHNCLFVYCIFAVRRKREKEGEGEEGTRGSCISNIALITSQVTSLSGGFSSSPSVCSTTEISLFVTS